MKRRPFFGKLTLRQQFAEHRSNASCAGCHAFLDPMGFAFENYDAIGRWRDQEKKLPIDASGSLVRGQTFKNLAELRAILVATWADQFVKNLAENLLTYALGPRPRIHRQTGRREGAAQGQGDRHTAFRIIILAVCESVPFQKMRVGQQPSE
jgi:hypothetical protein